MTFVIMFFPARNRSFWTRNIPNNLRGPILLKFSFFEIVILIEINYKICISKNILHLSQISISSSRQYLQNRYILYIYAVINQILHYKNLIYSLKSYLYCIFKKKQLYLYKHQQQTYNISNSIYMEYRLSQRVRGHQFASYSQYVYTSIINFPREAILIDPVVTA